MAVEGRTHRPVIENVRCETCGVCIDACPAELVPDMRREEGSLRGRLYSSATTGVQYNAGKEHSPPGCQAACPIGQDVRGYIRLVFEKQYRKALELIRKTNPLPSVCGYVCPHPCESACTRGRLDDPLSIRSLKRFLSDYSYGGQSPARKSEGKNQKVVIIGTGPAGLTAAHELAAAGYNVEMLESYKNPGGMLAWAIPAFRLPRDVLLRDIAYIEQMGVRIRTSVSFGRDETLSSLRKSGAHALVIATGTQKGVSMDIHEENGVQGYFDCLTFLRKINDGEPLNAGNRVLVVGGGNAAMDTARSALRERSRKVTLLYRRSREEMPAHKEEVTDALREGVEILFLTAPVKILATRGKVTGLECMKTRLGEADASGRRRPVPVEGSRFEIAADTIISAVGQQPDYEAVSSGLPLDNKPLQVNPTTMHTHLEGVFVAGDFLHGTTTVVQAMASGRRAARAVDVYLCGLNTKNLPY